MTDDPVLTPCPMTGTLTPDGFVLPDGSLVPYRKWREGERDEIRRQLDRWMSEEVDRRLLKELTK